MKKADEAKQASTDNFIKVFEEQYKMLLGALEERIEIAINKAEKSTQFKLSKDRFTQPVVDAVIKKLRDMGYQADFQEHNALQTITFNISWKTVK